MPANAKVSSILEKSGAGFKSYILEYDLKYGALLTHKLSIIDPQGPLDA